MMICRWNSNNIILTVNTILLLTFVIVVIISSFVQSFIVIKTTTTTTSTSSSLSLTLSSQQSSSNTNLWHQRYHSNHNNNEHKKQKHRWGIMMTNNDNNNRIDDDVSTERTSISIVGTLNKAIDKEPHNNDGLASTTSTSERSTITTTTTTSTTQYTISNNIINTDDPCVVLMKQLILKHQKEYEINHPDSPIIYSLAQGIVYWEPPITCTEYIINSLKPSSSTTTRTESSTESTKSSKVHLYTPDEGLITLQNLLQNKIQNENQLLNHNIIITSGANQAYMNCILSLLSPSSTTTTTTISTSSTTTHCAVLFAPYYFNHYMALQMTIGINNIFIGTITQPDGLPDIQWLQNQFILYNTNNTTNTNNKRIQMVTITNPCNPTGIAYTKEQIVPYVNLCKQYQCYLILDATYEYFVYNTNNTNTNNSFTACFNNESHVIHIFSFSKSYAMAGYRIGYMVIPRCTNNNQNEIDLYKHIMKVQDTIAIAPSHIGQIAAIGALQTPGGSQVWVQNKIATLDIGRNAIYDALQVLQPTIILGGSGAMYYMAQLPSSSFNHHSNDDTNNNNNEIANNDIEIAERLIRDYGIAIIPGTYCGAPGYIRVCYANLPPDQCIIAAQRLKHGLQEIYKTNKND